VKFWRDLRQILIQVPYVPCGFNYKCIPVFIFAERSRVDDEYDMQTTSQLF